MKVWLLITAEDEPEMGGTRADLRMQLFPTRKAATREGPYKYFLKRVTIREALDCLYGVLSPAIGPSVRSKKNKPWVTRVLAELRREHARRGRKVSA